MEFVTKVVPTDALLATETKAALELLFGASGTFGTGGSGIIGAETKLTTDVKFSLHGLTKFGANLAHFLFRLMRRVSW